VRHVIAGAAEVRRDHRGWIDEVVTTQAGPMRADLYVDCTGFRSLPLGKALAESFISFQDVLPNNRAVALRVPHDPGKNGMGMERSAKSVCVCGPEKSEVVGSFSDASIQRLIHHDGIGWCRPEFGNELA